VKPRWKIPNISGSFDEKEVSESETIGFKKCNLWFQKVKPICGKSLKMGVLGGLCPPNQIAKEGGASFAYLAT
jgi:hypothetical protein